MHLFRSLKTTLFVCAVILGSSALCRAEEERIILQGKETRTFEQMVDALSQAAVVVVGEEHDHKQGHALELEIFKGLFAKHALMIFSLEMFERDVQLVLDEYLSNQISKSSFLAASRPWQNYATDYAPLIEFCKDNYLPVLAANAPRRYVSIASRMGQSALLKLSKQARSYLAKLPYSMVLPPEYDRALTDVFSNHGAASNAMLPQFPKEGQALWDATMADSILRGLKTYGRIPIMQINGSMHSDYGYGLVDRLRKADRKIKVMIVSIKRDKAFPNIDPAQYDKVGDFVIVTKDDTKKEEK